MAIEVIKIIAVPALPQQRLLGAANAACFTLVGMDKWGRFTPRLTVSCIPTPGNLHSGERPEPLFQPACFTSLWFRYQLNALKGKDSSGTCETVLLQTQHLYLLPGRWLITLRWNMGPFCSGTRGLMPLPSGGDGAKGGHRAGCLWGAHQETPRTALHPS